MRKGETFARKKTGKGARKDKRIVKSLESLKTQKIKKKITSQIK